MRNKFSTRKKIFAVLAAGLVVGIGGTMTLASWTDTEWALGGNGTAAGVGTSTFSVDQNADNPFLAGSTFSNHSTLATANPLSFSTGALALTPGDTVYAPVALTNSATSIAGALALQPAVIATGVTVNDTGSLLSSALHLSISAVSTAAGGVPPTCDAAGFALFTKVIQTDVTGLFTTHVATSETLPAAGSNVQHYCFKITLPTGSPSTLQGRTTAPVWQFVATSN
jgi:predicted ribosomally synthesized peptide with SipW-like signal peptide